MSNKFTPMAESYFADGVGTVHELAYFCCEIADAMLAERAKGKDSDGK